MIMRSLLEQAQQCVAQAIPRQAPGVALVIPSKRVDRSVLVAKAFATAIETLDTGNPFRALYVATHVDLIAKTRAAVNAYKLPKRFTDEGLYERTDGVLPPLRTYNYADIRAVVSSIRRFATSELDLLVVDERAPGKMDEVAGLITSEGSPSFTLVLTKYDPPPTWAWRYLGEPIRILSPEQVTS